MATSALSDTVYQQKRSKELIDSILNGKQTGSDYSGSLKELGTINPNTANLYGTNVSYANASANKYSASGGYFDPMTSKEDYIGNLTTKITDMFNQQESAITQQSDLAYSNEIGALEKARTNIKEDARLGRRDLQASNIRSKMDLERRRTEMGLAGGGEALSDEVDIDISNEENANKLGMQVMKQLGEIEGQKVNALRNKDAQLKIDLAKLGGAESEQLLSAYKEAENYNMTKLSQELNLAKTGEEVKNAIIQAEERQKAFAETVRQFNVGQASEKEQLAESKRQFEKTYALQLKQLAKSGSGGSSGQTANQKAVLEENKRQFDLEYALKLKALEDPFGIGDTGSKTKSIIQKTPSIW